MANAKFEDLVSMQLSMSSKEVRKSCPCPLPTAITRGNLASRLGANAMTLESKDLMAK